MNAAQQPYRVGVDGPFGHAEAAHLLRRAGFAARPADVEAAVQRGLAASVEALYQADEGDEARQAHQSAVLLAKMNEPRTIQAAWLLKMLRGQCPGREKLALFWHGHFATSIEKVKSASLMWRQYELFREHGGGSFRELLRGVARDPAMLKYLDGNLNRKGKPNENFAREVMELFSLGVGHYTEEDIQEAARAFSGWHVKNEEFWFNDRAHDAGPKTVFGATVESGDEVVDRCAAHPACATFLARKLLRFYVIPESPTAWVQAVASWFTELDGELLPVLRRLFTSRLFFAEEARRATVKSPVELVAGTLRVLEASAGMKNAARLAGDMGQELFGPPSVKGWDGDQAWINSHTLLARNRFASAVAFGGGGLGVKVDWERVARNADTPRARTQAVLHEVHQGPISAETQHKLQQYADQHHGEGHGKVVRGLVHLLLSAPEFQLN